MLRSLAWFIRSDASCRTPWLAGYITMRNKQSHAANTHEVFDTHSPRAKSHKARSPDPPPALPSVPQAVCGAGLCRRVRADRMRTARPRFGAGGRSAGGRIPGRHPHRRSRPRRRSGTTGKRARRPRWQPTDSGRSVQAAAREQPHTGRIAARHQPETRPVGTKSPAAKRGLKLKHHGACSDEGLPRVGIITRLAATSL